MPRRLRCNLGGFVYHALHRGVGRGTVFAKAGDFAALEKVLRQAPERVPLRLLAWCLLPNHWQLVLGPEQDGPLSSQLHGVTMTHTQRWHAHYHSAGSGPVYQGRFQSFAVQEDEHLQALCRQVERHPLRAGLVKRAEDWRWSSLWHRVRNPSTPLRHAWPMPLPEGWLAYVNGVETSAELAALRRRVQRGLPLGHEVWQRQTAEQRGLCLDAKPRGRPGKVVVTP